MHDICGTVTRAGPTGDLLSMSGHYGTVDVHKLGSFGCAAVDRARRSTHDPGIWQDSGLLVIADARLDDRAQLVRTLGCDGPPAQMVAAAYQRWGDACVDHLLGDYAFAIWDADRARLFCARDHIGGRPFFYATQDDTFYMASDTAGILAVPGVDTTLDADFVAQALTLSHNAPFDRSFYRAIHRLDAGHCLSFDATGLTLWRHYHPERTPPLPSMSDADYVRAGRALVAQAIKDRLDQADRVAVHLSGGLDSSLVAALATPLLRADGRSDPVAYAWQKPDPAAQTGECAWIETMRASLGLTLRAPTLDPAAMADLIARDGTCTPAANNLLHEAAVQTDFGQAGGGMILSGWGGDETISCNGDGYLAQLLARGQLVKLVRQAPLRRLGIQYANLRRALRDLLSRGVGRERIRDVPPDQWMAAGWLMARLRRLPPRPGVRMTSLRRAQHERLAQGLVTARIEDWALSGRTRGIEYSYPLLDRRVMDFAFGVPPHLYRNGGIRRWLMREICAGLLPDTVRLNTSKREPLRTGDLHETLKAALGLLEDRLHANPPPPGRADYVDMTRLANHLAAIRAGRASARPQTIRNALQLLNIGAA